MDAIDAIQRRISVRRFRATPVPPELIARLLECAVRAPNHKLTEPWRFAVLTGAAINRFADIRGRDRLKRYADPRSAEALAAAEKMRHETADTPAFVVVMCAENPDEKTREEDYAAVMMATANLMIAAESLGLGTFLKTGGILTDPDVAAMVDLHHGYRIVGIVSLGYPRDIEPPRRRRPADELTSWITS